MSHCHDYPSPRKARRQAQLFKVYQASGSSLPYATWLKHHAQERTSTYRPSNLPGGYAVALGVLAVLCAAVTVALLAYFRVRGKV